MGDNNSLNLDDEHKKVDIFLEYEYSLAESGSIFIEFLEKIDYSKRTKQEIHRIIKKTHKLYPTVEWLQNSINKIGIIGTGKIIEASSARGTAYLNFLAMIRVIDINFTDYFNTNPTTLKKIYKWYEPYLDEIGTKEFLDAVENVVMNTNNRVMNVDRNKKIALKTIIYLIMRYKLKNIHDLTFEVWNDFIEECREHSASKKECNYTQVEVFQIALYNMNIFNKIYATNKNKVKRTTIKSWSNMEYVKPIIELYLETKKKNMKKSTISKYMESLNRFFSYICEKYGEKFKLSELKRKDIVDYITNLHYDVKLGKYGLSYLESLTLNLKVFLRFISENSYAIKNDGFYVFAENIIIDSDFRTPRIKKLPRPLDESSVEALMKTLRFIDNRLYKYAFLIMLTSGISKIDLLNLKNDCIKFDKSNKSYILTYYRVKAKKEVQVKLQKQTAELIEKLQQLNTQEKELEYLDGTMQIFLFNDGCKKLDSSWFNFWLDKHRKITIDKFKDLEPTLKEFTAHKLRHTFASIMREKGADILTLKYLLGHESIITTQRYVKESDKRKIELIDKIKNNKYYCEAMEEIDEKFIESEEGLKFIDNMIKIENKLLIGNCTINGYKNCPMAFKCIDCIYLCSTKEDLQEMIDMLNNLREQYKEYEITLQKEKQEKRKLIIESNKSKVQKRIKLLCKKIKKIQEVDVEEYDLKQNENNKFEILSFVEE